ncbi:MAG: hypothetical protein ACI9JN_002324 [Bacteroidia bacterium]|jgi:hypothetical protein
MRKGLVILLCVTNYWLAAQLPVLRPTSQSSLLVINPGLVLGNHASGIGVNYVQGHNSGTSWIANFAQHNEKIGGVYSLVGMMDDNSLGTKTKSISGTYAYRIVLNRHNAIQLPITYSFVNMDYDSIHFGNRYGSKPFTYQIGPMNVKSHTFGAGVVYYNTAKYIYAFVDTASFYPSYNYFIAAHFNHIFGDRRQMNTPEESDFTLPVTWSITAGYQFDIGDIKFYPTASYQYQDYFGSLSTSALIKDMHVFDLLVNAVYEIYLLGIGGRQISYLEHVIYGQAGVSLKHIEVVYSYGTDVLNREKNVRHQISTSIGWRQKKPPRRNAPIINPSF